MSAEPTQSTDTNNKQQTSDCSYSSKPVVGSRAEIVSEMTRINEHPATSAAVNGHPAAPIGTNPLTVALDQSGPLPNEIFELLNEFWRPNECLPMEQQQLTNGKAVRRSSSGLSDETIEEEKEQDEEMGMTAEQDQDPNQDRNVSKRRYSRLSDGYERLKSVLPSVKDKRRVSKARILDEAINYIQRLESITNVLKREHEKRMQLMGSSNGYLADYGVQPFVRSLFPKQMYQQQLANKMSTFPKMGMGGNEKTVAQRLKAAYQYTNTVPSNLGPGPMPTDYNGYSTMGLNYTNGNGSTTGPVSNNNNTPNNNNNTIYQSDPTQIINGDASPISNTSPYSACSVSPGTPNSYQNGSVNNSWPYHQSSINAASANSNTNGYCEPINQPVITNRQGTPGYNTGSSYTSMSSHGMWNGMPLSEGSMSQHADHSLKVV